MLTKYWQVTALQLSQFCHWSFENKQTVQSWTLSLNVAHLLHILLVAATEKWYVHNLLWFLHVCSWNDPWSCFAYYAERTRMEHCEETEKGKCPTFWKAHICNCSLLVFGWGVIFGTVAVHMYNHCPHSTMNPLKCLVHHTGLCRFEDSLALSLHLCQTQCQYHCLYVLSS